MFEIALGDALRLWDALGTDTVHIPNLAVLVCADSRDHVADMGAETGS